MYIQRGRLCMLALVYCKCQINLVLSNHLHYHSVYIFCAQLCQRGVSLCYAIASDQTHKERYSSLPKLTDIFLDHKQRVCAMLIKLDMCSMMD